MLELSADNGQQGPRTEVSASKTELSADNLHGAASDRSSATDPRLRVKGLVGLRAAGSEIGRVAPGARRGENLMAQAAQKITLSSSRDIPFDKLVLSQSNAVSYTHLTLPTSDLV